MPAFPCPSADLSAVRSLLASSPSLPQARQQLSTFAVELLLAISGESDEQAEGGGALIIDRWPSSTIAEISVSDSPTFRDFVNTRFESDILKRLKKTGRRPYEYSLARHILPVIGDVRLSEITFAMIQDGIVQEMLDAGYAVHTAKEARRVANTVFIHARRVKAFRGTPPTFGTRFPVAARKRTHALRISQAKEVLQVLDRPFREMALLSMTTGMNLSEVCALRWKRLNLSSKPFRSDEETIPPYSAAVRETFHRGLFGTPRTEQRRRFVTLPRPAVVELRTHRRVARFSGPDDIVFSTRTGKPYLLSFLHDRIKRVGIDVRMPALSWSCFRNTFAALSEQFGVAPSDRQAQMGLATAWMMERYPSSEIDQQRVGGEMIGRSIA